MGDKSKLLKQIIFFGAVGVLTLAIDTVVTAVCFYFLGIPAYASSAIGFLSGFFFNFPMNRRKVFHHSINDRFSLRTQVIFYVLLSVFNLIFTSYLVEILVHANVAIQYAKFIVTAMIAVWNFVL